MPLLYLQLGVLIQFRDEIKEDFVTIQKSFLSESSASSVSLTQESLSVFSRTWRVCIQEIEWTGIDNDESEKYK